MEVAEEEEKHQIPLDLELEFLEDGGG